MNKIEQQPGHASQVLDLAVELPGIPSFDQLRHSLVAASRLTGLVLLLSCPVPNGFLHGVSLDALVFFKTNIPHSALVDFLVAHAAIATLSLDRCGRGPGRTCRLAAIDLSHVIALEIPTACVRGTAHNALLRLTMEAHNSTSDVPAVLRGLPGPLNSLLYLTVDIYPYDYDILERIVIAAPRIRSLKLVEQVLPTVREIALSN